MSFIPALRRQRQSVRRISEFEFRLVYRTSLRTARATQRNLVLKNKQNKTKMKDLNRHSIAENICDYSTSLVVRVIQIRTIVMLSHSHYNA